MVIAQSLRMSLAFRCVVLVCLALAIGCGGGAHGFVLTIDRNQSTINGTTSRAWLEIYPDSGYRGVEDPCFERIVINGVDAGNAYGSPVEAGACLGDGDISLTVAAYGMTFDSGRVVVELFESGDDSPRRVEIDWPAEVRVDINREISSSTIGAEFELTWVPEDAEGLVFITPALTLPDLVGCAPWQCAAPPVGYSILDARPGWSKLAVSEEQFAPSSWTTSDIVAEFELRREAPVCDGFTRCTVGESPRPRLTVRY